MLLKLCNVINVFCQSFLFVWACDNIASKDNKLSKFKFGILASIISAENIIFIYSKIDIHFSNFIMLSISLLLIILFYRKSIKAALIGYGSMLFIFSVSAFFLTILNQNINSMLSIRISPDLQKLLFIYIPMWAIYFLLYMQRKHLFNIAIYIKNLGRSFTFYIIADFVLIFIDTLYVEYKTETMNTILRFLFCIIILILFILTQIYFAKINDNSREVKMLNDTLNEKITELRKIKHDYGSEISSLYGLYRLGKIDRLGNLLKGIVERYQSLSTSVSVNIQATPMIASMLNSVISEGINVIVFDSGDYDNLCVTDDELLKLLSNIIKNSVDALKDVKSPIIKFKSYNSYNGIIFIISNNGPQIPQKIKDKIFDAGFSTKNNKNGDRGYGLSIVKDIILKCNGKISIESDNECTQFQIEIPHKAQ